MPSSEASSGRRVTASGGSGDGAVSSGVAPGDARSARAAVVLGLAVAVDVEVAEHHQGRLTLLPKRLGALAKAVALQLLLLAFPHHRGHMALHHRRAPIDAYRSYRRAPAAARRRDARGGESSLSLMATRRVDEGRSGSMTPAVFGGFEAGHYCAVEGAYFSSNRPTSHWPVRKRVGASPRFTLARVRSPRRGARIARRGPVET